MKLGAYAISLNEQHNVVRFCAQTQGFDSVTVLDTGSTDHTVTMLRAQGVTVHEHAWSEFDFSVARNLSAQLTPEDQDWLMVVDFNDHFDNVCELRNQLTHTSADAATVNYLSSEDPAYCEHKLRLHRPHTHTWCKAVHEYLIPMHNNTQCAHVNWNITKHVTNKSHKHLKYTEICERAHTLYPDDPHYSWWALKYYRDVENWHKLQYFCEHYLAHTQAYTVEFRVYAWIYLSECVQPRNWDKAVDLSMHAFSESLVFKHQIPSCTSTAAGRLHALGINITHSGIMT